MTYKDIARHIVGINVPCFGLQWVPPTDQRRLAQKISDAIGARRLFSESLLNEQVQQCHASAQTLRQELKQLLDQCPLDSIIYSETKSMLKHLKLFVSELDSSFQSNIGLHPVLLSSAFHDSLEKLRAKCGTCIAHLSIAYGIDVEDELAIIIPFNFSNK